MIHPVSRESSLRSSLLILGDFSIACSTVMAAVYIRRTVPIPFTRSLLPPGPLSVDRTLVLLFGTAFITALALAGFYSRRILSRARPILMVALVIQVALVSIASTLFETRLPRSLLIAVPLMEALLFPLWRLLQQRLRPVRARDTILVGDPPEIASALEVLENAGDRRIHVIGYAGSRPAEVGARWLGRLDEPAVRKALHEVPEVICLSSDMGPRGRLELLRIRGPRGFLLLASSADALLTSSVLGWMGDEPLIAVMIGCGFGIRAIVKRAIDIVLATLLIALTLPLSAVVAITLWLDHERPILLRQIRLGLGGVPFGMWKFRSMRAQDDGGDPKSDDERITGVGRLLRRYHIDELPQLLNVLVGDMSLVGPRPERPQITERILQEVPDFDLRCLVRPGIAGLAQILAEYDSRPAVKLRYDLTYMCSWSLWLDVRLLFSSVAAALSGTGV
jgi:lipopolysaccharide/colanic/teichoic acid biosynthesis glycosyltransferase